ncbi:YxcD family protein [Paenibacillus sp. N4]|uniref:YxcD family protein n=1 Tax=Paenibacillus vietnamensis TaxID=2590547 RepID=UPI001CD0C05D|nr:YxcD family protein [Paenibacillus vietnamensis]MCA0758529.1 YxcD family protein [Paenibacillus vietnamensis]
MRIYSDEIINAICMHMAQRRGVKPTDVEVQLSWEEEYGFTAEVWVNGRSQYIIEANILEAIEQYMYQQYNRRVFRSGIKLDADEQFWADIEE